VLLDWDNTLHDSATTHFAALRRVLAEEGIPVVRSAYRLAYTTDYRTLYRRLGLPEERIDAASRRWRALLADERPRLLRGVGSALEALARAGVPLALVTSGPRETVLPQLTALGLADRFAAVVYGEGQPARPDPAPLREALARLRSLEPTRPAAPGTFAYCSDTTDDMRMGRAAGVHAVGIASFAHDHVALRDAGADETAPSVADWVGRWLEVPNRTARSAGEERR